MSNFEQVIDKYRNQSYSSADKGSRFERLIQSFLLTYPLYANELDIVWMWNDFPYRKSISSHDTGIDLVGKTKSNQYWAIQCKFYDENAHISKADVDTFLSTSARAFTDDDGKEHHFAFRLWVDTTIGGFSANAAESFVGQQIKASILNYGDLANSEVDWKELDKGINGKQALTAKKSLLPHQQEALNAAEDYFKTNSRGKLIMACGTGKTYTSLRIAERLVGNNGKVLFLVPSISLLGQTLREWCHDAENPIRPMCVCSDSEVSQARSKNEDTNTTLIEELAFPASTRVDEIERQYNDLKKRDGMLVVFSTYQSIERVAAAQQKIGNEFDFDLIICDEAHRTTGVTLKGENESAFVRVHNDNFIRAAKRMYMTATPRLYREADQQKARENEAYLCSMDDAEIYGQEFYRLGFGEAVDKNLLSDYKVLILTVDQQKERNKIENILNGIDETYRKEIDTDDIAKLIGCINALSKKTLFDNELLNKIDPQLMHRAVAFCRTIKDSKAIAGAFNICQKSYFDDLSDEEKKELVQLEAKHVDGSMGASKRDGMLQWLKKTNTERNDCHLLTNVRCLSEGVDVPSLDAVLFLSPKNSQVDVVQSVGRVMRRAEGKKYGYIIIPIVVPADVKAEDALDNNKSYSVVWDILNALRAHDDRFNAMVNKIELNKKRPNQVQIIVPGSNRIGQGGGNPYEQKEETANFVSDFEADYNNQNGQTSLVDNEEFLRYEVIQNAIFARMVQKVGSKRYWEQWAADVAKIAERHITQINKLIAEDQNARKAFDKFMNGLHKDINPSVTEAAAVEMLAQHIITQPVFEALFEDKYPFTKENPISKALSRIVDLLNDKIDDVDRKSLERFYDSVRQRAANIDNAEAKQKIVVELYDKFFSTAFPRVKEQLGIVYTPVEVVDFIIHSVEYVLKKQFGRSLADDVKIIDPFTGTGTFITRLLQSGIIPPERLEHKYLHDIFANEIVLLAYYIASVNIENVYHDIVETCYDASLQNDKYTPFPGICLTDTFELGEQMYQRADYKKYGRQTQAEVGESPFAENSARVQRQLDSPITVVIGNPPYSAGQKSANDNAQNQHYELLEKKIDEFYVKTSEANLSKTAYDSYIKAFRYSTDRIDGDGVIAFVSNGSWLDSNGLDGFRKSIEQEFADIYVFNLRGNARTQGELRRKEAGNVFDSGSRTPVSITLLVKKPHTGKAVIHYHDIGYYLSREQKLQIIRNTKSVQYLETEILHPNEHGDWINMRNDNFSNYIPIEPEKKFSDKQKSFFIAQSCGVATSRDTWCYNYSAEILNKNITNSIDFYNKEVERIAGNRDLEVIVDDKLFSWDRQNKKDVYNLKHYDYNENSIRIGYYRPFIKQYIYFNRQMNNCVYQIPQLFPNQKMYNLMICISSTGATKNFSCIITNTIPDYQTMMNGQCFPLYYYEKSEKVQGDLFRSGEDEYIRHEAVTDFILDRAREQYGGKVSKEDIFYYVYGFLHCKSYRETFANDLKKMLPRIPLVEKAEDFWAFSKAGRDLAELHLNYENVSPCADVVVDDITVSPQNHYRVEQMRFGKGSGKEKDKSVIVYNPHITLRNIPLRAYNYVVNGKSGIEHGNPRYPLDLLQSIINLSLKTLDIVENMPEVKF